MKRLVDAADAHGGGALSPSKDLYVRGPKRPGFGPVAKKVVQKGRVLDQSKKKNKRWGAVDCEFPTDRRLERDHLAIYIIMAAAVPRNSDVCELGQRLIGDALFLSHQSVGRRQEEMAAWGHMAEVPRSHGQRGGWRLLSSVFAERAAKAEESQVEPVQSCGKCNRECKVLGKAGLCRSCVQAIENERRAHVAVAELGPHATAEEIAAHMHIQKITPKLKRAITKAQRAVA